MSASADAPTRYLGVEENTVLPPITGVAQTPTMTLEDALRFAVARCDVFREEIVKEFGCVETFFSLGVRHAYKAADKMGADAVAALPDRELRAALYMYSLEGPVYRVSNRLAREADR